ncbi:cysteine--tRNA ligase [Patescibacteria group bacterium]|nr:cysteine--tRNA ligase [Patescibacteria group bacterium]MBU2633116.1 cysteine--tRNA ligase [Patescibacteria group bacterium]
MAVTLYNYLTRKKEIFKPINNKQVGLYTCGPTVYDKVHIGNLRTYIFEDVLKRTLEYDGQKVRHVMNITDIDDKIIKRMQGENKTLEQVTKPYTELFHKDIEKLNIEKANHYPKATEHIQEMIKLIETLLDKDIAYKSEDGSVYFDISKFENYGSFALIKKDELKHGTRIKNDEYDKKNISDFVLWKSTTDSGPSWDAPFGKGRPGWHIECSAMSAKYLGETIDIHAGAVDLIFPHHQNEIAQSESATGKQFASYWIEGEHLLVNNQKMSKSLGNFYTLDDIEQKNFEPLAFRYLALNVHYRSKINFTWQGMESSQNGLGNLRQQIYLLGNDSGKINDKYKKEFSDKINEDLNTPQALAVLQKVLKSDMPNEDKLATVFDFDKVMGLRLNKKVEIPRRILILTKERERARQEKNWEKSDKIRIEIEKLGYKIEDSRGNNSPHVFPFNHKNPA